MSGKTESRQRAPQQFVLDFCRRSELPRLAWCLEISAESNLVRLVQGAWVETFVDGFCEGSWAGEFARADFDEVFMTGTGAKITPDGLMLTTPNHTLDRINVLRKGDALYASNSLAFLQAKAGEELDPDFLHYDSYVASIRLGLTQFERFIPTKSGRQVIFFYCCNVLVTAALDLIASDKRPAPSFASYAEYKKHLDDTVSKIARNADDASRAVRYVPLATISRGYDSPAAMVVAIGVGCREAVTFRSSRGTIADEDCGTPIAEAMGLKVVEFGRLDYRASPDFPESENSGGPNEFLSFGDSLAGRLVFTGFQGDKIWGANSDKISRDLERSDASGSSFTEYRLRVGFCHLPVPFIGAERHPELHAIANSVEMRPWAIGNSYDRPIARRIVEEAGIPRGAFGQKKRAAGVVVSTEGLGATLSPQSHADFKQFSDGRWTLRKALNAQGLKLIRVAARLNTKADSARSRLGRAFGVKLPRVPRIIPRRLDMLAFGYAGRESLLFHWGVEKLVKRYRVALRLGLEP
jgi:hypothetical protein